MKYISLVLSFIVFVFGILLYNELPKTALGYSLVDLSPLFGGGIWFLLSLVWVFKPKGNN